MPGKPSCPRQPAQRPKPQSPKLCQRCRSSAAEELRREPTDVATRSERGRQSDVALQAEPALLRHAERPGLLPRQEPLLKALTTMARQSVHRAEA